MSCSPKFRPRRILAALLLLVYGSAGIFGYGLHALWHVHPGHDHGNHRQVATSAEGGHCHGHCCSHSTSHAHSTSHKTARFASVEGDCSICAVLAQAQTPPFEVTLVEFIAELGQEPAVSEEIAPLFVPADHLARGPPALC